VKVRQEKMSGTRIFFDVTAVQRTENEPFKMDTFIHSGRNV
jgi:hypothetical protein